MCAVLAIYGVPISGVRDRSAHTALQMFQSSKADLNGTIHVYYFLRSCCIAMFTWYTENLETMCMCQPLPINQSQPKSIIISGSN